MLRKLISLLLLLTTVSTGVGMEGPYKKEEISETNLPTDAITLISSEGDEFQVTPHIVEFSDMIKGFFEASSVLPPSSGLMLEAKNYKLKEFESRAVELLANLINKVQQVIDSQTNDKELALDCLIKAPNGHIIAKNLQKIVDEHLENEIVENLKQLLRLTDCFMMPEFCNAVVSIYLHEFQKEHKIFNIADLKIWLEKFGFGERVNDLFVKHWYLQQAGITEEWSIRDLIAAGEKPKVSDNGTLDLINKGLTSLDGLHDLEIDKIVNLELRCNKLVTLSPNIFKGLRALELLSLSDNQLSTLPENLFQGLGLHYLYFKRNKLEALPENFIQGLTTLNSLNLCYNRLSSLPESLFQELTALGTLLLYGNQLTEQNKQKIKDKVKQVASGCWIRLEES